MSTPQSWHRDFVFALTLAASSIAVGCGGTSHEPLAGSGSAQTDDGTDPEPPTTLPSGSTGSLCVGKTLYADCRYTQAEATDIRLAASKGEAASVLYIRGCASTVGDCSGSCVQNPNFEIASGNGQAACE